MKKSTFVISKMDCPSEENLIRMKLDEVSSIKKLEFEIPDRKLFVYHTDELEKIETLLTELNLGSKLAESEDAEDFIISEDQNQRKVLLAVLAINFAFFIIEMSTGIISKSMGLVADSLDMLADSFVYGISLIAVGGSLIRKKKIAKLAGYFQIALALVGFVEVLRRFIGVEQFPDFKIMIIVSIFALIANAACLYILQKSKSDEAHMKASMIFTSNDIIINTGVIAAAVLVYFFESGIPDLAIGTIVFVLVVQGAVRILKLGK